MPILRKSCTKSGCSGGREGCRRCMFQNFVQDHILPYWHNHEHGPDQIKQEPRGHQTSASNVAWIIVNYSSTRVSWPLLALHDWEDWILVVRYSENNVTVEVGQLYLADTCAFLKAIPIPNLVVIAESII